MRDDDYFMQMKCQHENNQSYLIRSSKRLLQLRTSSFVKDHKAKQKNLDFVAVIETILITIL